ncbi:MAG: CaiB/BaiF CoA transferase family protein [Haloarculaceae archaeon]
MSDAKPLDGIRVVDAGHIIAGPLATSLLAEFGADVITVEHPEGDSLRRSREGVSIPWKVYHRNKRAVTLDLSKPEGAAVLVDLARDADVLVENFRGGQFESWGLTYDRLAAENEGLVFTRVSGFGQTGPDSDRAGFGRVTGAASGVTHMIGEADGPPMMPSFPLEDAIAGVYAAYGTMLALFQREFQDGTGQVVDLAMVEALLRTNETLPTTYDHRGVVPSRNGNRQPNVAPNDMFRTADGHFLVVPASNENAWQRLARAMGRPDLLEDERFADMAARVEHADAVTREVHEWIAARDRATVEAAFSEGDVVYAFVNDVEDVVTDDHFQARGSLTRVPDDRLGDALVADVVPRLSRTPGEITHLGPPPGAHNDEVYRQELGYSETRLAALAQDGVI